MAVRSVSIQLASLPTAASLDISEPHRYIVRSPVCAGPQAAIIEVQAPLSKKTAIFDALIVVPAVVPLSKPHASAIHSAAMKVVEKDYKALLSRAKKDARVLNWLTKKWNEVPFVPGFRSKALEHAYALVSDLHGEILPSGESVGDVIEKLRSVAIWSPQHLSERNSMAISKDHWRILTRWADWEANGLSWEKRYRDFDPSFPMHSPAKQKENKERMRKLCAWMWLSNIRKVR